jgi:predicted dinucleotide-binding enzyme
MNIGIVGAGNVGSGIAKRVRAIGHDVLISFARDTKKLDAFAHSINARAGSVEDAARFGEVLVLATPWASTAEAIQQIKSPPKSTIMWDCTNALKPDLSGLAIGTVTSAGEEVARLAPWASVVKAIPPFAEVLHQPESRIAGELLEILVCSDHPAAKKAVTQLLVAMGFECVDAGPLQNSRYVEPAYFLLVQLAYKMGYGSHIALKILRENRGTA